MKGHLFIILAFLSALCFGCQKASSDLNIILHDHPDQGFKYSKTPIKRVVVWYFSDDPGGHLRIYWDRKEDPHDTSTYDFQLSHEGIEQIARTKQVVVELDGGTSKTIPITISNNKYSRNDKPSVFRQ